MGNQRIELIGNLGKDPEYFNNPGQKPRATFSVAVNEKYVTRDGDVKENTTWFNCVAFDRQAEYCYQYLKKGAFIVVHGKMQFRKYTSRDGEEKKVTEVIAQNIFSSGSSRPQQNGYDNQGAQRPANADRRGPNEDIFSQGQGDDIGITDEDIPF